MSTHRATYKPRPHTYVYTALYSPMSCYSNRPSFVFLREKYASEKNYHIFSFRVIQGKIIFLNVKKIYRKKYLWRKINSTKSVYRDHAEIFTRWWTYRVQVNRKVIFNKFSHEECHLSCPIHSKDELRFLYPDFLLDRFSSDFATSRIFPLAKFRSVRELNSAILQNSTESDVQ